MSISRERDDDGARCGHGHFIQRTKPLNPALTGSRECVPLWQRRALNPFAPSSQQLFELPLCDWPGLAGARWLTPVLIVPVSPRRCVPHASALSLLLEISL